MFLCSLLYGESRRMPQLIDYKILNNQLQATKWGSDRILRINHCPSVLTPWLLEKKSMSKRLSAICHKHFVVDVLKEEWQHPFIPEAQFLSLSSDDTIWGREVNLLVDNQTWIYGRSLFPKVTIDTFGDDLLKLETNPLGIYLFNHPNLTRSIFQYTYFTIQDNHFWARRSLFLVENLPIYVCEVFLPTMLHELSASLYQDFAI